MNAFEHGESLIYRRERRWITTSIINIHWFMALMAAGPEVLARACRIRSKWPPSPVWWHRNCNGRRQSRDK